MIKVMHCISDTNFGGAGRVLLNYLQHFDADNFDVIVVVPKGSKLLTYFDVNSYRVIEFDGLFDRSYNKEDVKKLTELIAKEQPDIVHSHGALSARIAAKKCRRKIVYTRHSVFDLAKWQTSFVGKIILGSINRYYADRIIAVSPAAKDLLVNSGTKADIIDVVFNGVKKLEKVQQTMQEELKECYGIKQGDFVCTIMARLEEVKGHAYIIDAFKILKEKGISDIKLLIAGAGGIEEQLKKKTFDLGVEDVVQFVGFVKDIPALLSITDLQLNASYGTEATSMALLEGFSLGVPAVVSDFGGNPFVVTDGENGLIFPKKDAKALSDAIFKIKQDPKLYQKISEGAQRVFVEKFTSERMTENMEQVYYKMLEVKK